MQQHVRLIFKAPNCYDDFSKLATRKGLSLVQEVRKGKGSPLAFQEILTNLDRTVDVQYIDDDLAEVSYLQISGHKRDAYVQLFKDKFAFLSEDELFAHWDQAVNGNDPDEKIDAIVRIGIAMFDQAPAPYIHRIAAALRDPSSAVRDAGLVAFSYAPWPEMKTQIEDLHVNDPDSGVRECARLLLKAWDER